MLDRTNGAEPFPNESRYKPRDTYLKTRNASDIPIKIVEWAIPNFFPKGELTVLAGPKVTGKSTLYCEIAAAISRGESHLSWPEELNKDPAGVLIFSSEDDVERTIIPRLKVAEADLTRIAFVYGVSDFGADIRNYTFDPKDDSRIENTIRQLGGVALIVIDPWSLVVKGDARNGIKVQRTLENIKNLANRLNVAILMIAHVSRNSKGSDPVTRVSGSSAITDVARGVFITAKIENGPDADGSTHVLVRAATNLGKVGGGLSYSIQEAEATSGEISVSASKIVWHSSLSGSPESILNSAEKAEKTRKQSAPEKAANFLREFLKDGPRPSPEILSEAEKIGISGAALQRAKKEIVKINSHKQMGAGSDSPFIWTLVLDDD